MQESKVYELILSHHVRGMVGDMLATQNICSVTQDVVVKELDSAKNKTFKILGEGIGQSFSFLLALDAFKTTELTKFCLTLSMSRLSNAAQAIKSIGAAEEALLIDGAEQMAQFLQEGFHKDASEYLARTLNIKSEIFKDIKSAFQEKES